MFNVQTMIFTFGLFALDKLSAVIGLPIRIPNVVLLLLFILGIEAWLGCVLGGIEKEISLKNSNNKINFIFSNDNLLA